MMRYIFVLFCLSIFVLGCKDKFEPDLKSASSSYLVVEGVLNMGGPTIIKLSQVTQLDTQFVSQVQAAAVLVEGKDNVTQVLSPISPGSYFSPGLNLVTNEEYRLRIRTTNGKEYLSSYIVAKTTPSIDSIGWRQKEDGNVQIYSNTKDPSNNTLYYRWDFEETWELRSYYYPYFLYEGNGVVRERQAWENVSQGWKNAISNSIIIGSSVKLQSDIMHEVPIKLITAGDEKLAVRYSILLKQYALDKGGYEFYELMKKNTEGLGSIFDVQPSEIRGNITCISNPEELVVGYVTASSIQEKRIFIAKSEIPSWRFVEGCTSVLIKNDKDSIMQGYDGGALLPYDAKYSETNADIIVAYHSGPPPCTDVTFRGASLTKPTFW